MAGPRPALVPNTCALASETAVGPIPAPRATLRKKLMAMASPRDRLGTTSRMAEKPQAVTVPDSAKYRGTDRKTTLYWGTLINRDTGRISRLEARQTPSL